MRGKEDSRLVTLSCMFCNIVNILLNPFEFVSLVGVTHVGAGHFARARSNARFCLRISRASSSSSLSELVSLSSDISLSVDPPALKPQFA